MAEKGSMSVAEKGRLDRLNHSQGENLSFIVVKDMSGIVRGQFLSKFVLKPVGCEKIHRLA